jgi:uncharacterized membrane protein YfhO
MPGWRVWVDGKTATVERANAVFIGTEVPSGTHRVEFRFLPVSAVFGVALNGLTAIFLFFSLLMTRKAPDGPDHEQWRPLPPAMPRPGPRG